MLWRKIACALIVFTLTVPIYADDAKLDISIPDLPDAWLVEVYRQAAVKNVLAAVNPAVFPGYWAVCADGQGFGYGNSYPSLDGHQLSDALIRLGGVETVKANWDYVKTFQRADGSLPLAILPGAAGQKLWYDTPIDVNGGLYAHWVPGNPLAALADPTYIANAEIIFAVSQDQAWLAEQIDSINLSATRLATLVTPEGRVRGAGYYIERPTRVESDGVAQSHAIDAFRRVAALNRVLKRSDNAARFEALAEKIRDFFVRDFWKESQFAEYYSPEHGYIVRHGLTDSDWAAIALGVATPEQITVLYPALRAERGFHYGTMPAGIATKPETYEDWEFTHPDRHDLGAMGRVWYLTAQAQAMMNDPEPLLADLKAVADEGRKNNYSWRERYHPSNDGNNNPAGPDTYCEYPSNLIRIVQRFLLGVDLRLDGSIVLAPTVTDEYWQKGFGQEIRLPDRTLKYRFTANSVSGTYQGKEPLRLSVRFSTRDTTEGDYRFVTLQPGVDFVIER